MKLAVPIDPAFPTLELAWDVSEAAREVVAALGLQDGWRLSRLRLERIRHRPGIRHVVQYVARFTCGDQYEDLWLAAVGYGDGRAQAVASNLARRTQVPAPPPLRAPAGYCRPLGMVVSVFPLDRRLPGLRLLATDAGRRELAQHTVGGAAEFTPVRYRLGLSATVRAETARKRLFLKFHPGGKAQAALELADTLRRRSPVRGLLVGPAGGSAMPEVTWTEAVAGEPLDQMSKAAALAALPRIVNGLVALHRASARGLADRSDIPAQRAQRVVGWLALVLPDSASLLREVARRGDGPGARRRLVHGDLKPEHVLVGPTGLRLVDVDSAGAGRPLSDLASLAVRLPRVVGSALVASYGSAARPSARRDWPAEWALASLKLALHHAQRRRAGWEAMACSVLEQALKPLPLA